MGWSFETTPDAEISFALTASQRAVITFQFDAYPWECRVQIDNGATTECSQGGVTISGEGTHSFQLTDTWGDGGTTATITYQQHQDATVGAASIQGDPHMQNVRGEKQDLLAPGTYNILELPSGKGDSLSLIGEVSYVDHWKFCNPLFLTKLRIIGTALGNQEFKFDLGNSSDAQSFSVTRTNMRTKKSEFFQVSEPINKQFGPVELSTAQCKKGQVGENSKNCWDSFNTMALKLPGKDGNFLTLNVRRGGQLGFFDVKANGLDALGMSVGGLLGTNGFTSLGTSTDKTCHNKRRSELKSLLQIDDHVHIEQSLLMAKM